MKKCMVLLLTFAMIFANVTVKAANTKPFKNHNIPGFINSVDFDEGDEGVAYSPLSVNKTGNYNYRDGVNLNFWSYTDGAYLSFNKGEWLIYTVNVLKTSEYTVSVKYGSTTSAGVVELSVDDKTVLSSGLASTGSWTVFDTYDIGNVVLTQGTHILKFKMVDSGMSFIGLGFSDTNQQNAETWLGKKSGSYRQNILPTIIEAEDYDLGVDGSYSKTEKNQGKKYRPDEAVNIYEGASGYYIDLSKDEFTRYTFTVKTAGVYEITAAAAEKGGADFYFDNSKPLEKELEAGINNIITLGLEKGQHTLTVVGKNTVGIDYIRFITSDSKEYVTPDEIGNEEQQQQNEVQNKIYMNIYVSPNGDDNNDGIKNPVKTVSRAREIVSNYNDNMDGDIVVNLADGYYKIDKTEVFDETQSGKNGFDVIWKNESVLAKPIIGGGIKIGGWEKGDNEIWKAYVPELKNTRTLYINDRMAQRARSKYKYIQTDDYDDDQTSYEKDGIIVSAINFPNKFVHPEDTELVWNIFWTSQRVPVKSISYEDKEATIIFDQPAYSWNMTRSTAMTRPSAAAMFYIENDLSLLDEPGEFYFDKETKMMYYYPYDEEDMKTADVYAGDCEILMKIEGTDINNKIENLIFRGIEFKYGEWNEVSTVGIACEQADKIYQGVGSTLRGTAMIPAQIQVNNAKNIEFSECSFRCLGSGGIGMINSVSNSKITGNVFTDISGSGVILGHWDHINKMPDGVERVTNVEVSNNVIRRCAQQFMGCCAISGYYVNTVSILHNDIKDMPYTGITLGWGWEAEDITDFAENTIAYNRVENVMTVLHDGGHIYTLGPMRNSSIHDNFLVYSNDTAGGIYLDQGSAHLSVYSNVVLEAHTYWLNARPDAGLRNINVFSNFTDKDTVTQDKTNVKLSDTTVVTKDNLPEAALLIKEKSGVESKYKRLLYKNIELPAWADNITLTAPSSPFRGQNAWFEAEDYLNLGQGIGYYKAGQNKQVTTYQQGARKVIGNTEAEDWLKYSFEQEVAGEYTFQVRVSNNFDDTAKQPKVKVYMDDNLIFDKTVIPNTGGWDKYEDITVGNVYVSKGEHIIKIEFADNGFSFDSWRLYKEGLSEITQNEENFDEGVIVHKKKKNENKALFSDIENHWAKNTIEELTKAGVIKGVTDTEFAPDEKVTLYQSIWLLLRVLKIEYTEDNWKQKAYERGFLNSADEQDAPVMRERFVSMAVGELLKNKDKFVLNIDKNPFLDTDSISQNLRNDIICAYAVGLVVGDDNKCFNPKNTLSRAEAAVIILKLLNNLG